MNQQTVLHDRRLDRVEQRLDRRIAELEARLYRRIGDVEARVDRIVDGADIPGGEVRGGSAGHRH